MSKLYAEKPKCIDPDNKKGNRDSDRNICYPVDAMCESMLPYGESGRVPTLRQAHTCMEPIYNSAFPSL